MEVCSGGWDGTFRRVTVVDGVLFLELIERLTKAEGEIVLNTVTVYELGDAGRIVHLDVYAQHPA